MNNNWTQSTFAQLKKSAIINYSMPSEMGNSNALLFLYYREDLDEYKAYLNFTNQTPLLSHEISIEQIKQYAKNLLNISSKSSLDDMVNLMTVQDEKKILDNNIINDCNNKRSHKL